MRLERVEAERAILFRSVRVVVDVLAGATVLATSTRSLLRLVVTFGGL
jgi:hypothetical protein